MQLSGLMQSTLATLRALRHVHTLTTSCLVIKWWQLIPNVIELGLSSTFYSVNTALFCRCWFDESMICFFDVLFFSDVIRISVLCTAWTVLASLVGWLEGILHNVSLHENNFTLHLRWQDN